MKKQILTLCLLASLFTACKKDHDCKPETIQNDNFITAVDYNYVNTHAFTTVTFTPSQQRLVLRSNDGKLIEVFVTDSNVFWTNAVVGKVVNSSDILPYFKK